MANENKDTPNKAGTDDKTASAASGETKTATKKGSAGASKKASPKKATTKKTTAKKVSPQKADIPRSSDADLQQALNTLQAQHEERLTKQEEHLSQMVRGLEKGLDQISSSHQDQGQKLASLMIGLEKVFHKLHSDNRLRDQDHSSSLDLMSETIVRSSEEMRREYEEMERLQEVKLQREQEQNSQRLTLVKFIAIPAIVLALLGLIHMFYTVTVMEKAMTRMSEDMALIAGDMQQMRGSMTEMTENVTGLRTDMATMTHQMQIMSRDVGVMAHQVAPAMNGMRQVMPWSP